MASQMKRWLLAAYGVAVVLVCSLLVAYAPQIRAAAEAREAHIVEEENRAFCTMFGIGPETARYAQCASELMQIRTRYLQRYIGDSIL
jgi:hypothetical protein